MGKVLATISMSLDGYVTGPDDAPGRGLGEGGERLHYWVFGGPWTYDSLRDGAQMSGADKEYYDGLVSRLGAAVCGRGMYDAAGGWGGTNPFPGTLVVLTHRVEDQPDRQPASSSSKASTRPWRAPASSRATATWRSPEAPT